MEPFKKNNGILSVVCCYGQVNVLKMVTIKLNGLNKASKETL